MRLIVKMLTIMFIIYSCSANNKKLVILNKTTKNVYFILAQDTILSEHNVASKVYKNDSIFPNITRSSNASAWEYKINNSQDSTLFIYIFDIDSLYNNQLTEDIIKNRKFKRYGFKVNDLDHIKWRLVIDTME